MKLSYQYGPYLVFAAAMLWASDAPFRVHLTESLSSDLIVLAEHLIVSVLLLPFLYTSLPVIKALTYREWAAVLVIGVGGSALALLLFTESFRYMNPSVVILLQKLQPLIAITLAVLVLKEATPMRFWWWAVLALGGAYLISFPDLMPQLYEGEVFNPHVIGVLLALGAAVLWAASTVLGRYLLSTISFGTMTALRFSTALIFLLLYTGVTGSLGELTSISSMDWLYLGIIAVVSGAAGMTLYYIGLERSRASVATLAELGFPLAAVLVNYIWLDAALLPAQILGMAILIWAVIGLSHVNQEA